jgi:hypothetical protein
LADRVRLSRSQLLQTLKFAGLADQFIPRNAVVVDAIDTAVEIFDGMRMNPHTGVVVVLTSSQLIAFRAKGVFGVKAPFVVDVNSIGEAGVTRQGNVSIEFSGEHGTPGLWKLLLGDMPLADAWMQRIYDQAGRSQTEGRGGDLSVEWKACRARLQGFCDSLAPFTKPAMVGQPLAGGLGLEQVMELIPQHFLSPTDVREADKIISTDLIGETGQRHITPDDLATVMGVTQEALRKFELSPPQLRSVEGLAGAARTFLGQLNEDGGEIWDLWSERDDVAAEFLCWHTVARLRLATIGTLQAIEPI